MLKQYGAKQVFQASDSFEFSQLHLNTADDSIERVINRKQTRDLVCVLFQQPSSRSRWLRLTSYEFKLKVHLTMHQFLWSGLH